jgi:hypothetical protein
MVLNHFYTASLTDPGAHVYFRAGSSPNYVLKQVNACCARFLWRKRRRIRKPFVRSVRRFCSFFQLSLYSCLKQQCLAEVLGVRFRLAYETLKLPMLEKVMSIRLFLFAENQSKIQRSMLYFEPE